MKRTKLMAFSLALAMLFVFSTLFISCNKGDGITARGKTEVDLTDYVLIYPNTTVETYTNTYRTQMTDFADKLTRMTGAPIIAYSEANAKTSTGKEILVGLTTRVESQEVYSEIEGNGFAIRVKKDKIVIVGTTPLFTLYAVQYFTEQYLLKPSDGGILSLHKTVKANDLPILEIANTDEAFCTLVFDESLDTATGNKWKEPGNWNDYDVPYQVLKDGQEKMMKVTGLSARKFPTKVDSADSADGEILFGMPDREEISTCLRRIPEQGYGVFVENNKVVVTAWSDSALVQASMMFCDLIGESLVTDEENKIHILFPLGLSLTGVFSEDWVTDFPKPDSLSLYNTQDAGDNSLQYLYMGEEVNASAFRAYCDKLEREGYVAISENEIEESLFATYVNEETNITLYVAYNAFIHGKDNYKYRPRLKVISSSLSDVNVPDDGLLTPNPSYEKKHDATITSLALSADAVGMGYVIMLEDGRFVLFDGGSTTGGSTERLWGILNEMHEKASGEETSEDNPIHIAAWFLTHSHGDHFGTARRLLSKYGTSGLMKLDYLLGNYPSEVTAHNAAGLDMTLSYNIDDIARSVNGGCKYVKIHTGQKYYLANLEIEVLYTQEDANPIRLDYFNDTSSIVRFTMHATDKDGNRVDKKEATTTSIWTGDAFIYGSRFTTAMYGPYLESDMVQVAHHGNNGCESPLYNCIKPRVLWWPHTYSAYRSYTGGWSSAWQYKVDYDLVYGIGSVEYIYTLDSYSVTLTLTENGPLYDEIYDALTGDPIPYELVNAMNGRIISSGERAAIKLQKPET